MTDASGLTLREDGAEYALSGGEGDAVFLLRCKPEGKAAHLAGDDATRFAADYATLKRQFPDWRADQLLAQLWDQGGYSWLAQEEEAHGDAD